MKVVLDTAVHVQVERSTGIPVVNSEMDRLVSAADGWFWDHLCVVEPRCGGYIVHLEVVLHEDELVLHEEFYRQACTHSEPPAGEECRDRD